MARLLKFGIVGSLGLVWDSATVYALRPLLGLTVATLVAYFVAATLNWALNRLWTFKGAGAHDHPVLQWLRFLLANSFGFLLNRGTVYTLFYTVPLCVTYPVLALAAGSLAGLFANFNLSQKMVFREKPPASVLELAEDAVSFPSSPKNPTKTP
ncbi:GtrA family protein [Acetobacter farinalis]|uniref:GtrA family protein n=1 Tax=Acetobacter farinalis TaxID=1260984 RepID=A0ABT3Q431_9PROT|nr:GtrA family protein [Acetobacter farinalis]MCX2559981.1 GtrA family protein [Acetobacter farinalis]